MKKWLLVLVSWSVFSVSIAKEAPIDLNKFAQIYFNKMIATQAPDATTKELEAYLLLLKDNVGHAHMPGVVDDSRLPDGKAAMREGMTFYLGAHSHYQAELLDVFTFNQSAVAIRYKNNVKGIHPKSNQTIAYSQVMMEVLEIEDGKVAVIRKYHE